MTSPKVTACALTHTGMVRKINEDGMLVMAESGLFGVADGMGGVAGGAFASVNALESVAQAMKQLYSTTSLDVRVSQIRAAIDASNREIRAWAEQQGVVGTGTTIILLTFDPSRPEFAALLHAGDSRAYLWRGGELQQLTRDHSVAESFGDGTDESIPAAFRNVVTNAIGMSAEVKLDETLTSLREGDVVLLCSDGLYRMVNEEDLRRILSLPGSIEDNAAHLIKTANDHGGRDNITVVLVQIGRAHKQESVLADSETHDTDMRSALDAARSATSAAIVEHKITEATPLLQTVGSSRFSWGKMAGWALAFIILGVLGWWRFIRPEKHMEAMAVPPLVEAQEVPASPPLAEPIDVLVRKGFETGDWSFDPALLSDLDDEGQADAARAWMDQWRRARENPPEAWAALASFHQDIQSIVGVWSPGFSLATIGEMPEDMNEAAATYCHQRAGIQEAYFSALDVYVGEIVAVIGAVGPNPEMTEARLREASGLRLSDSPLLGQKIFTMRNMLRSLNRWKEQSRHLPVGHAEVQSIATTFMEPLEQGMRVLLDEMADYLAAIPMPPNPGDARPALLSFFTLRDRFLLAVVTAKQDAGSRDQAAAILRDVLGSDGLKDVASGRAAKARGAP